MTAAGAGPSWGSVGTSVTGPGTDLRPVVCTDLRHEPDDPPPPRPTGEKASLACLVMSNPLTSPARRSTPARARLGVLAALTLGLGGLVGCSATETSFAEAAVKLIEGDLAEQAGLGALSATCEEPAGTDVGETFTCEAETSDGRVIEFTATVAEGDKVDVGSTNLVLGSVLPKIESAALQLLAEQAGIELPAEALDCGTESVLLDETGVLACTVISPDNGDRYDAGITIVGLDSSNPQITNFEIADTPRA